MHMLLKLLALTCLCLVLASPAFASNKTKKRSTTQNGPNGVSGLNNSMLPYYMWSRGSRRGPSYGFGYGGPIIVGPGAFGYPVSGF